MATLAAHCALLAGGVGAQDTPERPGLFVETDETHYELVESTLTGVIGRLNTMRLEGAAGPLSQGLTRYRIDPAWRPAAAAGQCRVANLEVRVRISITLPSWPDARNAPDEDRAAWEGIESAIREHEYAHRDLTVAAGEALYDSLAGLELRGCATLRRRVNGELSIADARLQRAHRELDLATPDRIVGRG